MHIERTVDVRKKGAPRIDNRRLDPRPRCSMKYRIRAAEMRRYAFVSRYIAATEYCFRIYILPRAGCHRIHDRHAISLPNQGIRKMRTNKPCTSRDNYFFHIIIHVM